MQSRKGEREEGGRQYYGRQRKNTILEKEDDRKKNKE